MSFARKIIRSIWSGLPPRLRLFVVRISQRKFTVSVVAVVINNENQILILEHFLRPFSAYGLPGGFIERGENPVAALRRELLEETGLKIFDESLYRVRTIRQHLEIVFIARGNGEVSPMSREIVSASWFKFEELPNEMSCGQKQLIGEILKNKAISNLFQTNPFS